MTDNFGGVPETLKQISMSSEEINTSDELVDLEFNDRLLLGQEWAGQSDATDDRQPLQWPMAQMANQSTEHDREAWGERMMHEAEQAKATM